ncbi:MAG: glycosyltransferase family 2 protein [Pirellulales bacterium]|nr:glycosyltransferase family 2 protein [Pirellulales bacterium]
MSDEIWPLAVARQGWRSCRVLAIRTRETLSRMRWAARAKISSRPKNVLGCLHPTTRVPRLTLSANERRELQARLAALEHRPRFSVLSVVRPGAEKYLATTYNSLRDQVYLDWELLVVTPPPVTATPELRLDLEVSQDPRLRLLRTTSADVAAQTLSTAVDSATGEMIGFVESGDALSPETMLVCAEHLARHPEADFLYSDEDLLDHKDYRNDPFHKPDWSPELLLCQHYTGQFSVYRRSLLDRIGGLRPQLPGALFHDLALRASEQAREVIHIPRVLYHRRARTGAPGSNSPLVATGPDALTAIGDALLRRDLEGEIKATRTAGVFGVRLYPRQEPRISIIIPTRDRAALLHACVQSVLRLTDYANYEIVIVNNDSVEPRTHALFRSWSRDGRIRVIDSPGPFNYSRLNNLAVDACRSPLVLLLNNDTKVIASEWLSVMAGYCQLDGVGAVGAKLYFSDDTIQHAGVILRGGGKGSKPAMSSHKFFPRHDGGYFGYLHTTRNLSVVTGACLLTHRDVYQQVGGLDEQLAVAYNDVDYCLKLRQAGYRIVWTAEAELYHYESASRAKDKEGDERWELEKLRMQDKWGTALCDDPYYNPNLSLNHTNFMLRRIA